jgi:hypothetical protein
VRDQPCRTGHVTPTSAQVRRDCYYPVHYSLNNIISQLMGGGHTGQTGQTALLHVGMGPGPE